MPLVDATGKPTHMRKRKRATTIGGFVGSKRGLYSRRRSGGYGRRRTYRRRMYTPRYKRYGGGRRTYRRRYRRRY